MLETLKKKLKKGHFIRFKVKVIPKSKKTEIVGMLDEDTVKIKIAATPENNRANIELIKFLSSVFKVARANIHIISGATSPLKIIEIQPKR